MSFLHIVKFYYFKGGVVVSASKRISDDYLKILEEAKKQYQQYLEVSEIYKLPTFQPETDIEVQPPSPENPLTENSFKVIDH